GQCRGPYAAGELGSPGRVGSGAKRAPYGAGPRRPAGRFRADAADASRVRGRLRGALGGPRGLCTTAPRVPVFVVPIKGEGCTAEFDPSRRGAIIPFAGRLALLWYPPYIVEPQADGVADGVFGTKRFDVKGCLIRQFHEKSFQATQ